MFEQEEGEVIHLDYNSEDEYEIPENETNDTNDDDEEDDDEEDESDNEGESEARLMEYLLKGLVLQSTTCGSCDTPLIKSLANDDSAIPVEPYQPGDKIEPIGHIPFCVACNAHVVTSQDELQILWKDEHKALMGVDGAVLLFMDDECQPVGQGQALNSSTLAVVASGSYDDDEEEEEEVEEEEEEHGFRGEQDLGISTRPSSANSRSVQFDTQSQTHSQAHSHSQSISNRPMSVMSASSRSTRPMSASSRPMTTASRQTSVASRALSERSTSVKSIGASIGSVPSMVLDNDDELNFDLIDYDKRRQIATKVLGAKMIEGYTLRETQCERCTMPVMETPDASEVICVVCPVLQKKVLKKLKERQLQIDDQRMEEEKQRLMEVGTRELEEKELSRKQMEEEDVLKQRQKALQDEAQKAKLLEVQVQREEQLAKEAAELLVQQEKERLEAALRDELEKEQEDMQRQRRETERQRQELERDRELLEKKRMEQERIQTKQQLLLREEQEQSELEDQLTALRQAKLRKHEEEEKRHEKEQRILAQQKEVLERQMAELVEAQGFEEKKELLHLQLEEERRKLEAEKRRFQQLQTGKKVQVETPMERRKRELRERLEAEMRELEALEGKNKLDGEDDDGEEEEEEDPVDAEERRLMEQIQALRAAKDKTTIDTNRPETPNQRKFRLEQERIEADRQRILDERKRIEEEQIHLKERLEEEQRFFEAEQERIREEEKRVAEEEEMRIAEELERKKRQAEERKRIAEDAERKRVQAEREAAREAERKRMDNERDMERKRLLDELRIAKEERAKEERRRQEEIKMAEKRAREAKEAEQLKELERLRLLDELRIAKQERLMEEMKRKEESLQSKKKAEEAEKLLKMRDEEQMKIKAELEQSIQTQKEQEIARKEEIEKAEEKAREAEKELLKWRKTAEQEAKRAEEVRQAAEKRAKDAEQAKIEAQQLAAEAKKARALAKAEKSRLSERQRLNELSHRAERHRMAAEAEAQKAQRALMKAEQKKQKYSKEREMHEGVLSRQAREAAQTLSRYENGGGFDSGSLTKNRSGPMLSTSAVGQDWDARLEIGKDVLASRLMNGWTLLPEYCLGRMCSFFPIVTKGDVAQCVVCEGSGNGCDGAYEDVHPDDMMEETMSYMVKKQRFENISNSMRRLNFDASHESSCREVGRRINMGWQLLESPCPTCLMPLMSENIGSPELCAFCDPDDDIEIGDEGEDPELDELSHSSRRSVTIELPANFNPNDPYAMARLAQSAVAASSGQSVMSRSSRANSRSNSRAQSRGSERSRSRPKPHAYGSPNRPNISQMKTRTTGRSPKLPVNPRRAPMRSQSPRPESRSAYSSNRGGSNHSRSRGNRNRTPNRNPESMYVPSRRYGEADDDASDISDNVSVAKSVASHTLDAIMSKIEHCKVQLNTPIDNNDMESVARKGEAAALMQKLAAAAVAVRDLE